MGALASLATIVAWRRSGQVALAGLKEGGNLFLTILPNLVFGFILAGMAVVLVPRELVSRWVGEGSGVKGLVAGTLLGAFTPGGPFAQFPLVASLFKMGAGVGPLAAYLSSWSLLGVNRIIVYEWPFLGAKFTMSRIVVSLLAPA
ncbi:MAG: permease, partial [Calditrichota bacterium]